MTQLCNGCKALIAIGDDDYQFYSLQRQLYATDPLFVIPQPNTYVSMTCDDGTIIKSLYHQGDDWLTFYQQMLAECANHKPFVDTYKPTVETKPEIDPNTPADPLTPDPNTNPVPGPDVLVPPPIVPPGPPGDPAPVPPQYTGPFETPPHFPPTPPPGPGNQTLNPDVPPLPPGKKWIDWPEEFSICVGAFMDAETDDLTPACKAAAEAYMRWAAADFFSYLPEPKYVFTWGESVWRWRTLEGVGVRDDAYAACNLGFPHPPDMTPWPERLNSGYYHELCMYWWFSYAVDI